MRSCKVSPTEKRSGAKGDYIVEMREELRKELGLGKYAIIPHEFKGSKGTAKFVAYGKVITNNKKVEKDCVKIDQTLRNAVRFLLERKSPSIHFNYPGPSE